MKRDALCPSEPQYLPSSFAVRTIAETCATTVRTRSGSPHDQSGTQDGATRFPLRLAQAGFRYRASLTAASIRMIGADLSNGLFELVDLVAEMIARLRIDD